MYYNIRTSCTPHYENDHRGWSSCSLDDISIFIRNGVTIKQTKIVNGFPITRIESISNGVLDFDKMGYADLTDEEKYKAYFLQANDILFSHINSPIYVGKVALCDNIENRKIVHGMNLLCIRLSEYVNSRYILYVIRGTAFKNAMRPYVQNAVNQASISINSVKSVFFLLPPRKEQDRIVAEIEKWFAIIDELESNKQDLHEIVKQTKSKVLDLAIHGKLVKQDPNDETAIELLKKINPHATVCDTSHYRNLPHNWCATTLDCLCTSIASKKYQIKQSEIKKTGRYPVISQSANYIEGYSDADNELLHISSPIIVFGDHTRIIKYIDFDFIVGADGVKILLPLIPAKFFFYLTQYVAENIENRGYSRHYGYLSKYIVPIPPKEEQERIALRIEELLNVLDIISAEL